MNLDLAYNARPTDGPFYLQFSEPKPHFIGWKYLVRFCFWTGIRSITGKRGYFFNLVFVNHLQLYYGSGKCDGSRTYMYRLGQLGDPYDSIRFVMTAQKSELAAARWRSSGISNASEIDWRNMGGA